MAINTVAFLFSMAYRRMWFAGAMTTARRQRMLTITEAADQLQVSVPTMRMWRHLGRGPEGVLLGRHLRYDPIEIRRWVRSQYGKTASRRSQ